MPGVVEERFSRGLFDNLAVLHDGYPACNLGDNGEVVGDEENGEVVGAA